MKETTSPVQKINGKGIKNSFRFSYHTIRYVQSSKNCNCVYEGRYSTLLIVKSQIVGNSNDN
mgnify:CR=1 FL=1